MPAKVGDLWMAVRVTLVDAVVRGSRVFKFAVIEAYECPAKIVRQKEALLRKRCEEAAKVRAGFWETCLRHVCICGQVT